MGVHAGACGDDDDDDGGDASERVKKNGREWMRGARDEGMRGAVRRLERSD